MHVLVTGSQGFIAKNLLVRLRGIDGLQVTGLTRNAHATEFADQLDRADIVFHLAGTNRPPDPEQFRKDNADLTRLVVDRLEKRDRPYRLIFSSSTQARLDNPYGNSKKVAEDYIRKQVKKGAAVIYRLPGVFGKWSRPQYNSVVATFCHNIGRGLPVDVRDPEHLLILVYVDDVVGSFLKELEQGSAAGITEGKVEPEYRITLGKLETIIRSFSTNRQMLFIPNVGDSLEKALYSTWLSFLPTDAFAYDLELKSDARGSLFELLKSSTAGQIFISTTLPGVTRGNHFHHNKVEKFAVIKGRASIQFRSVLEGEMIEYIVDGEKPRVVDIPPGYIHNITNTGSDTLITLFWANEVFDPQNPDTFFEKV